MALLLRAETSCRRTEDTPGVTTITITTTAVIMVGDMGGVVVGRGGASQSTC